MQPFAMCLTLCDMLRGARKATAVRSIGLVGGSRGAFGGIGFAATAD